VWFWTQTWEVQQAFSWYLSSNGELPAGCDGQQMVLDGKQDACGVEEADLFASAAVTGSGGCGGRRRLGRKRR